MYAELPARIFGAFYESKQVRGTQSPVVESVPRLTLLVPDDSAVVRPDGAIVASIERMSPAR